MEVNHYNCRYNYRSPPIRSQERGLAKRLFPIRTYPVLKEIAFAWVNSSK